MAVFIRDIEDCLQDPLINDARANIVGSLDFHHLNIIISGIFWLLTLAVILAFNQFHAIHLSSPPEQVNIMRMGLYLLIRSFVSFLSICFPRAEIYISPWISLFEALAMGSFFILLCNYVSPSIPRRLSFFASKRRNGVKWFKVRGILIFQMIIVAVFVSIALDISAAVGVYCQWRRSLLSVSFWLQLLLTVSFLISLFSTLHVCLVLKRDLANHRPVLKFFALISITILTFVQSIVFYVLLQTGVLQESDALTFADINIGIPNMVVCVELFPLSLFYMWAYPWNVYTNRDGLGHFTAPDQPGRPYQGGPFGYRAWLSTFNLFGYTRAILSSFSPKHQEQELFAETGDTIPLNPNPNQTSIELPIRTVKSRY